MTHYEFICKSCNASLRAKPKLAGRTLACPKCRADIIVPNPPTSNPEPTVKAEGPPPATEKQKAYAHELGIEFADDIDRRAISKLIDDALLKQEDERYDRLNELQRKESQVREELRAEVFAECDEEDPRLSIATAEQILKALGDRDIGAILVTFEYGVLTDVEDLTGERFEVSSTDDLGDHDVKNLMTLLGMAMLRR